MHHHDDFDLPGTMALPEDGRSPLRLLVSSYGLAAIAAVIAAFAGIGVWPSVLICWLGGVATTVAMAAIKAGSAARATDRQFAHELT